MGRGRASATAGATGGKPGSLSPGREPKEELTYERDATAQQVIARAYSIIILDHTLVITDAFRRGLHAPGFALVRPTLEATLKQYLASDFVGDDESFKRLARSQPRIDSKALRQTVRPTAGRLASMEPTQSLAQ